MIEWVLTFGAAFDFLGSISLLVLFIVQFLLAMNFARPQPLLLFFAFQVLSCILYNPTYQLSPWSVPNLL